MSVDFHIPVHIHHPYCIICKQFANTTYSATVHLLMKSTAPSSRLDGPILGEQEGVDYWNSSLRPTSPNLATNSNNSTRLSTTALYWSWRRRNRNKRLPQAIKFKQKIVSRKVFQSQKQRNIVQLGNVPSAQTIHIGDI